MIRIGRLIVLSLNYWPATKTTTNKPTDVDPLGPSDEHLFPRGTQPTADDPINLVEIGDTAPVTNIQQTTAFIDDTANLSATLPESTDPSPEILKGAMEARHHSIVDVLSRPILLGNYLWDDTQTRETDVIKKLGVPTPLEFPAAVFESAENLTSKLDYFGYFRADMCIRVIVNANTFQAGKILCYYTPYNNFASDRVAIATHMPAYTTYPHIVLDASSGNTGDLMIPFVAPVTHLPTDRVFPSIGTLFIKVLNKLQDGDCHVSVYGWFENISVEVPSGTFGNFNASASLLSKFRKLIKLGGGKRVERVIDKQTEKFVGQVMGEAQQKSSTGVISKTAHVIGDALSAAAAFPLFAPVAAPGAAIAQGVGRIAEYFGFNKTNNLVNQQRLTNVPGYGMTNAGGTDSGLVLGCDPENLIQVRGDVFGNKADEMDINFICSHSVNIAEFNWSTAGTSREILAAFPVTPGLCEADVDNNYHPSPMAFVSSMFRYWRGGIAFKIQAVKTAYHSGRLRISYIPNANLNTELGPTSDFNFDQCYNWVFDLRNSSEIEFTIPYVANRTWLDADLTGYTPYNPGAQEDILGSRGIVVVEVLNPLRAPPSVTQDIFLNLWIRGSDTLEFAVPDFARFVPSAAGPSLVNENDLEFRLLDNTKPDERDIYETFVGQVLGHFHDSGFSDLEKKPHMFKMLPGTETSTGVSIGESIQNLRQVTRRFGKILDYAPAVGVTGTLTLTNNVIVDMNGLITINTTAVSPPSNDSVIEVSFSPKTDFNVAYVDTNAMTVLIPMTLSRCILTQIGSNTQLRFKIEPLRYRPGTDQTVEMILDDTATAANITAAFPGGANCSFNAGDLAPLYNIQLPCKSFTAPYSTGAQYSYLITPVDYISYIYRFFRGGMRWKVKADTRFNDTVAFESYLDVGLTNNSGPAPGPTTYMPANMLRMIRAGSSFYHYVHSVYNNILELIVPYYSNTHISVVKSYGFVPDAPETNNSVYVRLNVTNAAFPGRLQIYKAAHDDLTFGWLIGAPILRRRSQQQVDFN